MIRTAAAALLMFAAMALPVHAQCGGQEIPCKTPMGSYHISLPDGDGPYPVMVFLHGYGGKGGSLVRGGGSSRVANARGYAFIAPNALMRPGGNRTSWAFHPDFHTHRDERAFLQEILQDATTRFNIDPDRAVLSGFSIGGSMASYIACDHPQDFWAFAPVSGSLWRPHRTECTGPVRLMHSHGWRDKTVPLEGRVVRQYDDVQFAQGDVFHSMQLWRAVNDCGNYRADDFQTDTYMWTRTWEQCREGTALQLVLFDGGHGIPRGWAEMAFDWLDSLEQ